MPPQLPPPPSDATVSEILGATPRRGFFTRLAALVIGLLLYVPAALAGVWAFISPLREKGSAGRFLRLTTVDALPADGVPQKFPIILDRTDAWTHFPQEPVGAVFLRRVGTDQVQALQVVCPHAGCHVGFQAEKRIFFCPCHGAGFTLDGKRLEEKSHSPRDLDTLAVEIRNRNEVWVKYEKFRTGTTQKIADA